MKVVELLTGPFVTTRAYAGGMANGVFHTGYGITINLTLPDLGHPERPDLLEEILRPVGDRDRALLECLDHHAGRVCRSENADKSPWMFISTRRRHGRLVLVGAHLPVTHRATPEESARHRAMKERIARCAERHGLHAQVEARSADGRIVTDVLVTGAGGTRIGWEAQYSPITGETVRRRSRRAVENGITPLWVTDSERAALIDRAPWVRVDDFSSRDITSKLAMFVRGGIRHLQVWKCLPTSERPCPTTGSACGRFHSGWFLPALCLPTKAPTQVDYLVVASADGEFVPLQIQDDDGRRTASRMWVPAADRDTWWDIVGRPETTGATEDTTDSPDEEITFTGEELDPTCRYGEETLTRNDPRSRRERPDATGLRTFAQVPHSTFALPADPPTLKASAAQRRAAAAQFGCPVWEIGPCGLCGAPIHRYGNRSAHACGSCRTALLRSRLPGQ
ncbi:hypothetical protein OG455_10500 [Kitasatospora sp. NBC_01287]|uniref:competence protein CoiA family protein n=1 Tax=Kitasatospora sp. NBC_01287 TaxID=2903573 RepID=UPI00224CDDD7|nr:hypothetical protein [Kitasatospora sp. NBC_01287]MCX4745950.1 hypothetical protein [Kitasatospora sp. NBC_01287]